MDIFDRIAKRRIELGLSRQALAKRLGCSRRHVWRIETGALPRFPAADLLRVAHALRTTVGALYGEAP